MIANRASTTSNGKILTSCGQVFLTASINGQEVFANKFGIAFKQASLKTLPMFLWYGNTDNSDSIVNWMLPTSNLSREIAYSTDSIDMSLLRWRIIFLIPVPALS